MDYWNHRILRHCHTIDDLISVQIKRKITRSLKSALAFERDSARVEKSGN